MTEGAKPSIRFGVAFRLLSAFAAITVLAIVTSAIALYTFGKYGEGFDRIASSNVPALVAASNLAHRSQALAANAPNLAVADGHFARRAVSEGLRAQLQAIAEASEQVKTFAPATEGLEILIQNRASLGGNSKNLTPWLPKSLRPTAWRQILCCDFEVFPSGFRQPVAAYSQKLAENHRAPK
jgi:phosphoglycerate-specific signal transduction histidine kinase